ncbi:MAG TPA: hypothetical protein VLW85_24400 [Myxococcales bacterium]|nr:hypothetical protein [Myxococcales bacterium]
MHRKIALILTAVIVPGGLIALVATLLFRSLAKTERGKRVVRYARDRVPAWSAALRVPGFGERQAA